MFLPFFNVTVFSCSLLMWWCRHYSYQLKERNTSQSKQLTLCQPYTLPYTLRSDPHSCYTIFVVFPRLRLVRCTVTCKCLVYTGADFVLQKPSPVFFFFFSLNNGWFRADVKSKLLVYSFYLFIYLFCFNFSSIPVRNWVCFRVILGTLM